VRRVRVLSLPRSVGMGLMLGHALLTAGCSSSGDEESTIHTAAGGSGATGGSISVLDGGPGATGGAPTGGTSGTGASSGTSTGGWGGTGVGVDATDFEVCAGEAREAEYLPADIFIMLDKSTSMNDHRIPEPDGPTRWEVVTQGLTAFVTNPDASGLGVGIQYFPLPPPPGDITNPASCLTSDYATPAVEIGRLPENAQAIIDSVRGQQLGSMTPSYPALEGALTHARDYAASNPSRPVAVLYATDGFPTMCDPGGIPDLVDLARSYASPTDGQVRVPTFVLGVGIGPDLAPNLDYIAEAGGTYRAHLVTDAAAAQELTDQVLRLASSPIMCRLDMPAPPPGEQLDPTEVNVRFTPRGGSAEVVGQVPSGGSCETQGGGWYYAYGDGPDALPTGIEICESTCSFFGGGLVEILVGCQTYSLG
jgi:hypothetical protein